MRAWTVSPQNEFNEIQIPPGCTTLDALSDQLPQGVYTTFRIFNQTQAIYLEDHFLRLEESAGLLGQALVLDRQQVRDHLRRSLSQFHEENARVRLSLDLAQIPGRIFIAIEKLVVPSLEEYSNGVKVNTRPGGRNNPRAKATAFIHTAAEIRKQNSEPGVNEILMVDPDGAILEGLSSNFFGIMHSSVFTAEAGVLSGVTRKIALEVIQAACIPVCLQSIHLSDLPLLEEAFITSASRGILPVAVIDHQLIGATCPGKLTSIISRAYSKKIEEVVTDI